MKPYLDLLKNIFINGSDHPDRTGAGRRSIFGTSMRFNMADGFPLVTTRQVFTKVLIHELLWFIAGDTNSKNLEAAGVKIWEPWSVKKEDTDAFVKKHEKAFRQYGQIPEEEDLSPLSNQLLSEHEGSVGPMYGAMWRNAPQGQFHLFRPAIDLEDIPSDKMALLKKAYEDTDDDFKKTASFTDFATIEYFRTVDQLGELVRNLKRDPYSARHVVTAWVPSMVPAHGATPQENVLFGLGCLAACHAMFQCFVKPPKIGEEKKRLSLMMTQRSVDSAVGAPYNIAQYALLLHMLAHVTDMVADELIWNGGDTHLYLNHLSKVEEQLCREPKPLPKLWLNPEVKDLFAFKFSDIRIEGYEHHPRIDYEINV